MQGILHTGVAAIRDQMRLGGIFNPMDDGMDVDPETGAIAGEGMGDSRKRARMAAMSTMMTGARSKITTSGSPVMLGAPVVNGLLPLTHAGTSGYTTPPNYACVNFWTMYYKSFKTIESFLRIDTNFNVPEPSEMTDDDGVRKQILNEFLLHWLKEGNYSIVSEKEAQTSNGTPADPNAVVTYDWDYDQLAHLLFETSHKNRGMRTLIATKEYGDALEKTRNELGAALEQDRSSSAQSTPSINTNDRDDYFEIVGGRFMTLQMATHLLKWSGFMSLDDDSIVEMVGFLTCDCSPSALVHMNALIQMLPKDNDDVKKGTLEVVASYIVSRERWNKLPKDKNNIKAAVIKAVLIDLRLHLLQDDTQANLDEIQFHEWIGDLWGLVTPYRKKDKTAANATHSGPEDSRLATIFAGEEIFDNEQDFSCKMLDQIRINVTKIIGYSNDLFTDNTHNTATYELYKSAQQKDYYYACMVKGAGVKLLLDRVWTTGEHPMPGFMDEKRFVDIVWDVIKKSMPTWTSRAGVGAMSNHRSTSGRRHLLSAVQNVKDIRDAMLEVWVESKRFRVSDEVHMIEIQVLQRLRRDGLIPWFDTPGGTALTTLEVCNWFRRAENIRSQFAMAVGRRIATESLVSTHNSGIMSHQRTVNWAEREYMALYQKVSDMSGEISSACTISISHVDSKRREVNYVDYLNLTHTNPVRERGERALYDISGQAPRKY